MSPAYPQMVQGEKCIYGERVDAKANEANC